MKLSAHNNVKFFGIALVATLLSACVPAPPATYSGEITTIRYQSTNVHLDFAELADALGYFDSISLERVGEVQSGTQALDSLLKGDADLASIANNGMIAERISAGDPLKAVIASYGVSEAASPGIVVLDNSNYQEVSDLSATKIGVNAVGAHGAKILDLHFKNAGLTPQEIEHISIEPAPPAMLETNLLQGRLDAIWLAAPAKNHAIADGKFRVLAEDVDLIGEHNLGSFVVTENLIGSNPGAISDLVDGIAQAITFAQTQPREDVLEVYIPWLEEHHMHERAELFKHWNSSGIVSDAGELRDEDFRTWTLRIPGHEHVEVSNFYTNRFNPSAKH